ncbi:DUF5063 domain-containing protein [Niabella aurantiaca]|uniref:DUF5063 domain-containing protein n=1 Tax=Niabella aurantiaca TaxID=379900 RepID=UPI00036E1673|nr:DUF5063 domain-containing protein [Niabella aurantiaca]
MTQSLSTDLKGFLEKETTQTFLKSVRQFIELLENGSIDKGKFYSLAHTALIDLYAAGNKLERIGLKYSSAESNFDRDTIFENRNIGLISELGVEAFYWEIFDPVYSEKDGREATQGWLVDDFADIYHDLKVELLKIDTIGTDEAVEDALWQLKWGFTHHWGQHCINALRYFHYLHYGGKETF